MAYTPAALSLAYSAGGDTPRTTTSNSRNRYYYNSPSDNLAACQASGYFSNGGDVDMQVGDIVEVAVALFTCKSVLGEDVPMPILPSAVGVEDTELPSYIPTPYNTLPIFNDLCAVEDVALTF